LSFRNFLKGFFFALKHVLNSMPPALKKVLTGKGRVLILRVEAIPIQLPDSRSRRVFDWGFTETAVLQVWGLSLDGGGNP
jgi:hypothetical protein